jgi:hypothetical protein
MHRIIRMGASGHTTLEYDPTLTTQEGQRLVKHAEQIVEAHLAKGLPAFAVTNDYAEKITAFDPNVEETLLALPLAGG